MDAEHKDRCPFYDTNLATYQINQFRKYGNSVALVEAHTDRFYTYADLIDRIQKVAAGLRDLGLRKGDVLCLLTYNHIDYHVIWYAVCMLGGTLQTAAPLYTDDDLAWRFEQCNTKFLVTTADLVQRVTNILKRRKNSDLSFKLNLQEQLIVYDGQVEGHVAYESLLLRGSMAVPVDVEPGKDLCILLASSGTTGLPKHVMLTHRNIVSSIPEMQEAFRCEPGACSIVCLAIFHHFGVHPCVNVALNSGLKLVMMIRYNLDTLLELIQRHKAEILHLVPPMLLGILKHPDINAYDLSTIQHIICAGASLGIQLETAIKTKLGLKMLYQAYGLTEVNLVTGNGSIGYREGSVGKPPRGVKLKIADVATGRELPQGQIGEIGEIRAAGPQVAIGYLHKPGYRDECLDEEGYFKTGDLGYIDSDGFLFYRDRVKELIKFKGIQVAPAYLEDILKKHPGIADAAVVGIPDEEAGELPKAHIVRQPGASVTEGDVHNHINERVASYMRLRGGVVFTDNIPKTPSGKNLRRLLKEKRGEPSKL